MKKFDVKKKIIFLAIGIAFAIFIIWYFNSYSESYEIIPVENNTETNTSFLVEDEEKTIFIHIAGEVKKEGVIEVEENSRVIDIIEKAGGLTDEADLTKVNLAYQVQDGQKIYIPNKKDEEKQIISSGMAGEDESKIMININTATQAELVKLPGVGESLANSIITYRKENGRFKNIEELTNVSGIGEAKFNKIKDYINL